jgi:hypothetical protein
MTSTPSAYANFGKVAHGEYAYGTGATDGNLRVLYDNLRALAADNETGYGTYGNDSGGDCNYPCGYAIAVNRSPCTQRGTYAWRVSLGSKARVVFGNQRLYVFHTKNFLYYRTCGASLYYTTAEGTEASKGLEDFYDGPVNDENLELFHYRVLDLNSCDGLEIGMYYEIRAPMDDEPNIIAFAFERDD